MGARERKRDVAARALGGLLESHAEDFARCRELGCKPSGSASNGAAAAGAGGRGSCAAAVRHRGADHYVDILASCQEHGLEPVVTLHHFVHPAWLGTDPWLDERAPALFDEYVRAAVAHVNERLARPIRWFITINEPNMLVLNSYLGRQFPARARSGFRTMIAAYNQLLRAHVLAYNTLHDLYAARDWPAPRVSFNNYCSDLYWSDKLLLDLVCARERGVARDGVSAHICERAQAFDAAFVAARVPLHKDPAYYVGAGLKRFSNWIGYKRFDATGLAPLLDTIYASPRARLLDYIGLDYYDRSPRRLPPAGAVGSRVQEPLVPRMLATVTSKGGLALPRGLHFFKHYR